jgi:hypothetical protein
MCVLVGRTVGCFACVLVGICLVALCVLAGRMFGYLGCDEQPLVDGLFGLCLNVCQCVGVDCHTAIMWLPVCRAQAHIAAHAPPQVLFAHKPAYIAVPG